MRCAFSLTACVINASEMRQALRESSCVSYDLVLGESLLFLKPLYLTNDVPPPLRPQCSPFLPFNEAGAIFPSTWGHYLLPGAFFAARLLQLCVFGTSMKDSAWIRPRPNVGIWRFS